ncbi:CPBP family glutamic-type intramembrane protease [Sphingomonas mucosissima]|uniref:CAAX amino terminal protease self-immunity n=1 Tax=Sphingomonas mucosissima TaxID=370959 RepID=A0A245ZMK9_9SPHN|nr:CPBP family glutamic-type intramembrane protease [Sphingomonas mucosissima]OWK30972.1 CAAX amino terminal protease self- immunity [Sphingomonas mucosissima]
MRARPIGLALIGVALVWAWLALSVPLAAGVADTSGGAAGEFLFSLFVFGPMLAVAIGLAWLMRTLEGWSVRSFGQGAMLGLAALALAVSYCAVAGTLSIGGIAVTSAWPLGLLSIGVQVMAEEAMFRGYVQPLLVRGTAAATGVMATAGAFALLHAVLGATDGVELTNMLLGGLLFGLLALRGGVGAAAGAHLAWNAVEQLGLGLDPNPGTGAFGALVDLDLVGAARWGGSDTGLNASWAMTFALTATLGFVLPRSVQQKPSFSAAPRAAHR